MSKKVLPQKLPNSFLLRIDMLDDWHVGSGAGTPGGVDKLIQRDQDGLPFIPAKTVTGIWRDACEQVANALDFGNTDHIWHSWVSFVFGNQPASGIESISDIVAPQPAILSVRAAHLSQPLQKSLQGKADLRSDLTFEKASVRIDPETGSASDRHLRFEEYARGGCFLISECMFLAELTEEEREVATILVLCGASLVKKLGGRRRRGAGRCNFSIEPQVELEPWLKLLESEWTPSSPGNLSESCPLTTVSSANDSEWVSMDLEIDAKTPLLVAEAADGNNMKCFDYIPGTQLLRFVSTRLRKVGIDLSESILNNDILFSNARLLDGENKTYPAPRCFSKEKNPNNEARVKAVNVFFDSAESASQLQPLKNAYISVEPNAITFVAMPKSQRMHNNIDDHKQRPDERSGGLYSYESFDPGTKFAAEIKLRRSLHERLMAVEPHWYKRLEGHTALGRSKKDDYGKVHIKVDPPNSNPRKAKATRKLTVWLLSPLLVRDDGLRWSCSIETLQRELEATLKVRLTYTDGRIGQTKIDSWHIGWGLPRPTFVGLGEGSCAMFESDVEIEGKTLTELETTGLGQRRPEGFGEISINSDLLQLTEVEIRKATKSEALPATAMVVKQHSPEFQFARLLEQEAWRNKITRYAALKTSTAMNREELFGWKLSYGSSYPTSSQLSNVRGMLEQLSANGTNRIIEQLQKLRKRNQESTQYTQKLERLISDPAEIWRILSLDEWSNSVTITDDGARELKSKLWLEAVKRLFLCALRAHQVGTGRLSEECTRGDLANV